MKTTYVVWALAALSIASNLAIGLLHPSAIFWDEAVYNNAAALILHGQNCPTISLTFGRSTVPIATPCNYEHPPLVKLLVATTLYVFSSLKGIGLGGNALSVVENFLSYRTIQLMMGALSLPLVYSLAYGVSGDRRMGVLASLLLFLEPLYAFFSRTDYLDVPMIFFALCAYTAYFGPERVWGINKYVLCGISLALSVLSKETGLVFVGPLVVYHLLFEPSALRQRVAQILIVLGIGALVAVAGLQLYDTLGHTPFPTFVDQILYMLQYSKHLTCPNLCNALTSSPWYYFLTPYYWMVGVSYNIVLLWSVFIWVPVGAALLLLKALKRRGIDGADRLFVLASLLFVSTFTQNELLYLSGRIIWVWYFLPLVPSLALGEAYLLTRAAIPIWVRVILGGAVVVGYFLAYMVGPGLLMYD